jgi:hypothetical protein
MRVTRNSEIGRVFEESPRQPIAIPPKVNRHTRIHEEFLMARFLSAAIVTLFLTAGGLLADEVKGKLKSVDADKMTITLTVDDKDQDFKLDTDTKILNAEGNPIKKGLKNKAFGKSGMNVVLTTEKDVVKELKTSGKKKDQ